MQYETASFDKDKKVNTGVKMSKDPMFPQFIDEVK
jgi:hypothetical protein